jgi:tetratricopeptide (TPR) repeat protein
MEAIMRHNGKRGCVGCHPLIDNDDLAKLMGCPLQFELELLSVRAPDIASLKAKADNLYRAGRFEDAARMYQSCLGHCDTQLKLKLCLNLAACELKLSHWNEVLSLCSLVLEKSPHNQKALFRRAKAYEGKGNVAEAIHDLKTLLCIENIPEAETLLRSLTN